MRKAGPRYRSTKKEILEHYRERSPKQFLQFDGHVRRWNGQILVDDVMEPDCDGHWICCGDTFELMQGANVRVLVEPGTAKSDVVSILRKITDCIEHDDGLKSADWYPNELARRRRGGLQLVRPSEDDEGPEAA